MYDDPATGLDKQAKLTKEKEVLECNNETRKEIEDLRTELGFSRKSKIVLMLSIASDEMIRLVISSHRDRDVSRSILESIQCTLW